MGKDIEPTETDTDYHVSVGEWSIDVSEETVFLLDTEDHEDSQTAQTAIRNLLLAVAKQEKMPSSYILSAIKKLLEQKANREMESNATNYLYDGLQALIWLASEGILSGSQTYSMPLVFLKIVKEELVPESGRLETSVNRLKLLADKLKKRDASRT